MTRPIQTLVKEQPICDGRVDHFLDPQRLTGYSPGKQGVIDVPCETRAKCYYLVAALQARDHATRVEVQMQFHLVSASIHNHPECLFRWRTKWARTQYRFVPLKRKLCLANHFSLETRSPAHKTFSWMPTRSKIGLQSS